MTAACPAGARRRGRGARTAWCAVTAPAFVGIVVPAHDEESHIETTLESLDRARRHRYLRAIPTRLYVVLDRCGDRTGDRAERLLRPGDRILEVSAGSVGGARRAGMAGALHDAAGLAPDDVWLTTTDADTLVGPEWLGRQLRWRALGAEAVAGTVTVTDWAEQPSAVGRRFRDQAGRLGLGHDHPHVHGANLCVGGGAYLAVGGMPAQRTGEDHALWRALVAAGRRTVAAGALTVVTSARRESRAPAGFSDLLRRMGGRSTARPAPA